MKQRIEAPRLRPAGSVAGAAALMAMMCLLAACATVDLNAPAPAPAPAATAAPPAAVAAPSLGFFSRINAPESHEPVLRLSGKGVQVFRCERVGSGSGYAWIFRLPEADLSDATGKVVGRHGANFSFEHADGSRLLGNVIAYDEAPTANNLRWLLMSTKPFGQGALSSVTHVQRVNTQGGMPPPKCEANQQNQLLRVDFSADFVFYKPR
jgi:hypothetical protein